MALPVTTVTRVPVERLRSPASVFVISADDIRRSGATTVAEVLRLAPGVHVARVDGNKWAIGIRGFTDRLARAMLVLVDGRAVYSPLFAGTYWEVQDLPLDDIERIEVVRGPGGALWGANAVTGIINIIRKPAAASQGVLVEAAAGTEDPALFSARYGGRRGAAAYRVSGTFHARDPQLNALGLEYDDAAFGQGGARLDWKTSAGSAFTLQGDVYRGLIGQRDSLTTYTPPTSRRLVTDDELWGANALFRWEADAADPRSTRIQGYYDRSSRSELVFGEEQHVADIDYQQGRVRGRHGLLWGAGYRFVSSATRTGGALAFTPPVRRDHLFSAFVQDEIEVVAERLSVTAGTKAEQNDYSGFEWQPHARVLWTPAPTHGLSFSVSRAVRTPSRVEHDFESGNLLSPAVPSFVRLLPNPAFRSEELVAYEAGLVTMPHPRLLATVAIFRNVHDHVLSAEAGDTFVESDGGVRLIIPVSFGNGLRGHSHGLEVTAQVQVTPRWQSTVNYSALRFHLSRRPGSTDLTQELQAEQGSPRHQVQVTTSVRLSSRAMIDWFFRYVSALPAEEVAAYGTSNLRIEWAVRDNLRWFVLGRNLHQSAHAEFSDDANGMFEIERAVLVGMRWTR
jgi:iron complex outermembrane receptor protein